MYQKLLVDKLVKTSYLCIRFLNVNHCHLLKRIIAADGKCLQLPVNIHSGHPHMQLTAVIEDCMDSFHLIVQVILHDLSLFFPPFIQEFPDLLPILAGQTPVLIPPFIFLQKRVKMIFLFVQLFAGQGTHSIPVIQIIL